MSEPSNPKSADFEEASSRLGEGLKSCRAVLSGYRALLVGSGDSVGDVDAGNSSEPGDTIDASNER